MHGPATPFPAVSANRTPLERQGALVLQDKQCRNCHSRRCGGQRGPALDAIASRMTEDQIIRQVLQGGGNMPAYGNALNPSETKALPMLRGLPRGLTRYIVGPLIRRRKLRQLGHWLVTPIVAWLAMNITFLAWHIPAAYDFALEHEHWHEFEHLSFLGTSILFWWPILSPWPSRAKGIGWFMLPYLVLADIVNTALSAFLAFCERPVYDYYLKEPNAFNIAPAVDQRAGAVIMWVIGSLVFLVPAVSITYRILQQHERPRV
jgi:hypothetical protein